MALILPLIAFFLVFQILTKLLHSDTAGFSWRSRVLLAAVCWGFLLTMITESLSVFTMITFPGIAGAWGVSIVMGVFIYSALPGRKTPTRRSGAIALLSRGELYLLSCVTFIVVTLALIAYVAPPNTGDSFTYHMSRVVHWMQNKNVNHYPTHTIWRLTHPPFAEFVILHLQVLSGGDRFANFVQWFSMLGSLLGVSLITKLLGGDARRQCFAVVVAGTIPMGILQATSTQNDYVTSFWLVCLAYFLMQLMKHPDDLLYAAVAGMSLGLAVCTKLTAYVYALPFLVWYFLASVKNFKVKTIRSFLVIGSLVILINGGQYARNYDLCGNISGSTAFNRMYANESYAPKIVISNIIRTMGMHTYSPFRSINVFSNMIIENLHKVLDIDINDQRSTSNKSFLHVGFSLSENFTGNFLHFILALIAALALLFSKRRKENRGLVTYGIALAVIFPLLSLLFKWNRWVSRYALPLFVLSAPFIALTMPDANPLRRRKITAIFAWVILLAILSLYVSYSCYGTRILYKIYNGELGGFFSIFMKQNAFSSFESYVTKMNELFCEFRIIAVIVLIVVLVLLHARKLLIPIGFFLLAGSLPWVFFSDSKPILKECTVFNTPRIYQYVGKDDLTTFERPVDFMIRKKCTDIGIVSDENYYEYVMWVVLKEKIKNAFRFESVLVDNISAKKAEEDHFRGFDPCAIIVTLPMQADEIMLRGNTYKKEWGEAGMPSVYVKQSKRRL